MNCYFCQSTILPVCFLVVEKRCARTFAITYKKIESRKASPSHGLPAKLT
jgi:hypothetical protein